jgi:hypothetical protein
MRDPHKSNALLFKPDGTEKTLHERGLAWDDPPLKLLPPPARPKPRLEVLKLKELAKRVTVGTETKSGVSVLGPGTKTKHAGGRPKSDKALSSAERKRRWKAKQKPKE